MFIDKENIEKFLSAVKGLRVLVIGDVMIDQYLRGTTDRQSPEAPVPILALEQRFRRLGGAANVALNLANLIDQVDLVGIIGDDASGRDLTAMLHDVGIAPHLITVQDRRTTVKTRLIARNEHLLRVDDETTSVMSDLQQSTFLKAAMRAIESTAPGAVVLQDYNKGVFSPRVIEGILEKCKELSIPIMVDPKFEHIHAYQGVHLFKPNFLELERLVPFSIRKTQEDLDRAAEYIRTALEVKSVLVTLSEEGAYYADDEGSILMKPSRTVDVVDVCGAGDSVIAVATLAYAIGSTAEEMVILANLSGGIVCTMSGVHPVSRQMLRDAVP
ncbi:MAG: carbohydrate kinase [Saprospiraceae bacterium]|nr:carbohydrate kinase [Saprospiraceae bacterium]